MDLTVVVPVYNGAATLADQLDALADQRWDGEWEVVVVDNGSTDATPQIIARSVVAHDRFRSVRADDAHNLSYVRNVGVRSSDATAVVFADADDVVGAGWVAAIGAALADHPLVGSRLEYERLNPPGTEAGRARFQAEGIGRFYGLPNLAGAGHGCRRDVFDQLGGNDERWDDTGEDFDFSFRAARDLGIEPVFVPDAVYHYRRRNEPRAAFRQARRYGRSHVALYREFGRDDPAGRPSQRKAIKTDLWLAAHAHHALRPATRLGWAWKAGIRLGRLEASIRTRTLYL
jgi:glycosyltransferase involved in cell wall biosynthesis